MSDTNRERNTSREVEIAEAERELEKMEAALCSYYCDVGKAVLEAAELEGRKANRLVDRIIATRRKLVELRGDTECPRCGVFSPPGNHFCGRCGQEFTSAREEKA